MPRVVILVKRTHKSPSRGKRGRRRGRKAPTVQGYLERKPRELLESQYEEILSALPHNRGVYALYKGERLYYIGIARHLTGRVWTHTKNQHAKKWDIFSLYSCKSLDQIKMLEALFLRITKPPGNGQVPSLSAGAVDLTRELRERNRILRDLLYSR